VGRIYTGLAGWNLVFLGGAFALGFLRGTAVSERVHVLAGLFAAIFCCLVHAIVFAHFIGSGKWIKEGVRAAGLEDRIVQRTKRLKGKTFPFALFSMLVTGATAVLGGGAASGAVSGTTHLVFAIVAMALNTVAFVMERSAILENAGLIDRVATANRARVEAGIAQTLTPMAAVQAAQAGGKVFVFLAGSVWLLYAYLRFVMRRSDEPWWPYLAASVVLVLLGRRMIGEERRAG
jgi:hypothetical protein